MKTVDAWQELEKQDHPRSWPSVSTSTKKAWTRLLALELKGKKADNQGKNIDKLVQQR